MKQDWHPDELTQHWTLAPDERELLSNVFRGRIGSIRREGVTTVVMVEAQMTFEVHLTPVSVDDLKLRAGSELWAAIKTYSCNLVEPSAR